MDERGPVVVTSPPFVDTLVSRGGARLRALSWTPASGAAGCVVVVHGLGEHAGRYGRLAHRLNEAGFAVFAYDQRGHGESEGSRGRLARFDDLVDDLSDVAGRVRSRCDASRPVFVLGHSLGGLVVLRYLQRRPAGVAGAVLSAPWLATAVELPWWKERLARLLMRVAPELTLDNEVRPELLTADPVEQRAYVEDPLVHHRISGGFVKEVEAAQEKALRGAPDPSLPLLFLLPTDDRLTDQGVVERYAEDLTGAVDVARLRGARHEPLNDVDRASVMARVARWLRERSGEGRDPS